MDDLLENPFGKSEEEEEKIEVVETNDDETKRWMDMLDEEGKKRAIQLAEQIDPKNHQSISQYGTEAQGKLMHFSDSMLEHVKNNQSAGEIRTILEDLMKKLESVNPDELQGGKKGLISRFFQKLSSSVNEILSKYQKTGAQIDRITVKLKKYNETLSKDNNMLQQLFDQNKNYFDALSIYIAAGELKLKELETKEIPERKKKAQLSGNQMAHQEVNDLVQFAERLEKRVHDLKLSRQITIQSAPQIRMIQNTNQALMEKIQSSILTAIPLWKNQIAIALTLLRQRDAVEAQKQVSKTTNELLLKNADMLKTNAIETAKENERGLVDIDTLKKTQENLITTIKETIRIQQEGREKRHQAEQELRTMEDEIKKKLLEYK